MRWLTLAALLLGVACSSHNAAPLIPLPTDTRTVDSITPGVPTHVQTAEYLWTSPETTTNPSVYAPYLTWAYAMNNRMGMTQAAGIKTVLYTSPMMPNANTYEYNTLKGSYPSVEARTCAGTLITTYQGKGLLSDPRTTYAASYYDNVVNHAITNAKNANPGYSHPWNLIFVDNDGPLYGASGTPCNYDPTTWGAAIDTKLATTGQPMILNALSASVSAIPTYVGYLKGSNIQGGEFEVCFNSSLWASEEDAQLQAIALLKSEGKAPGPGFWCYMDADGATMEANQAYAKRLYAYASFLLTYDPNYSVFQEAFGSPPSNFKVMPETGFVPLQPQKYAGSDVTNLRTSSGAYTQNYGACYYRATLIGACEIAVNPSTTTAVSLPNSFNNTLTVSGNGVLDGGTVSFSGPRITSLPAHSGAILVHPTTTSTPSPAPSTTPAPMLTGTVDYDTFYPSSGKFQIHNASGYSWICTNSSTKWSGSSLAVGKTADINYSTHTSACYTATTVYLF